METAPQLLERLLTENHLQVTLTPAKVRPLHDGGFVIDPSQIQVDYTIQPSMLPTPTKLDEPIPAETPSKTNG